jgi:hypothetical protein
MRRPRPQGSRSVFSPTPRAGPERSPEAIASNPPAAQPGAKQAARNVGQHSP